MTMIRRVFSNWATAGLIPRVNPFTKPMQAWLRNLHDPNTPIGMINVPGEVFNANIRVDLMHRVVRWWRASQRAGTACAKGRADVNGSNRKLHPQKGTGKARVGSRKAPQRRGGGVVFGPKPRDWSHALPPKLRAAALRSAMAQRWREGRLTMINPDTIEIAEPRTRLLAQTLDKLSGERILVLNARPCPANLSLASQQLSHHFEYINVRRDPFNVYHLLHAKRIFMTPQALHYLRRKDMV